MSRINSELKELLTSIANLKEAKNSLFQLQSESQAKLQKVRERIVAQRNEQARLRQSAESYAQDSDNGVTEAEKMMEVSRPLLSLFSLPPSLPIAFSASQSYFCIQKLFLFSLAFLCLLSFVVSSPLCCKKNHSINLS